MTEILMAVRIEGPRVRACLPPTIAPVRLPYEMIAWMERCAARMHADPAHWGIAAQPAFDVLIQIDDTADLHCASLGFGRRAGGQSAVRLIPDGYFIGSAGYAGLRHPALAGEFPAWRDRPDAIVWRGTTTGAGPFAHPLEMPRIRLCHLARDIAGADVKIMGIFERTHFWLDPGTLADFLAREDLMGDRLPMARHAHARYTIDIDGYANAWSFVEKLLCGCTVFKVATPFEQWFYDRLRPWQHFVPVRADLSDLAERVAWCRDNPGDAEAIAQAGQRVAFALSVPDAIDHTIRQIIAVG